jgi:hypothetical protein
MYLCIMKYENIKHYKPKEFRRLTGVKPATFAVMVDALRKAYAIKHGRGGRSAKLCIEDRLLAALGIYGSTARMRTLLPTSALLKATCSARSGGLKIP